jgi:hypothetical protein
MKIIYLKHHLFMALKYSKSFKADKHFQESSERITGVMKILLQIYHWDFGSMLISMADVDM